MYKTPNKVCMYVCMYVCNPIDLSPKDTLITPRGYVVTQRKMKERITPQAVSQMFELDFSEPEKGTAMSREDIKFCETVESGIVHLEDLHYRRFHTYVASPSQWH